MFKIISHVYKTCFISFSESKFASLLVNKEQEEVASHALMLWGHRLKKCGKSIKKNFTLKKL